MRDTQCHTDLLMPLVTLYCDQVLVSMEACAVAYPNLFSVFWLSLALVPLPVSSGTICGLKHPGSTQPLPPFSAMLLINPIGCQGGWAVVAGPKARLEWRSFQ